MEGRQWVLVYLGIYAFLERVCGGMEWWEGGWPLLALAGTGSLQTLKRNGISGCRNSTRWLLIFASGSLMLATSPLESLNLWELSHHGEASLAVSKCVLRRHIVRSIRFASCILCFRYKGSVQIFTTYYAVFIFLLCKTSPSSSCIHQCLRINSWWLILLNLKSLIF